jgi:hypothetical protein
MNMSIEFLVGAVIVFAVVVYFVLKSKKDETIAEPTLVADKVEAETPAVAPVVKAAPAKKAAPKKTATTKKATTKTAAPKKTATTGAKRGRKPKTDA